jgi:hypothetical protein
MMFVAMEARRSEFGVGIMARSYEVTPVAEYFDVFVHPALFAQNLSIWRSFLVFFHA